MDPLDHLLQQYAKTLLAFTKWEKGGVSKCTVDVSLLVGPTQARWLRELGLTRPFAVITACNPDGVVTSESTNDTAHEALRDMLNLAAVDTSVACMSCSPDLSHTELGLAVMMERDAVIEVGRHFRQLAIFWYEGEQFSIVPLKQGSAVVPLPMGN